MLTRDDIRAIIEETNAGQYLGREEELLEYIGQLEDRLQFDPGGSDRIDELEDALRMVVEERDRMLEALRLAPQPGTHTFDYGPDCTAELEIADPEYYAWWITTRAVATGDFKSPANRSSYMGDVKPANRDTDPNDRWLYAADATAEQLVERRNRPHPSREPGVKPHGHYTCDTCAIAPRCTLVFDDYNTDGDCLLEK